MFRVVKDKPFIKVIRSPKVQTFVYKHRDLIIINKNVIYFEKS